MGKYLISCATILLLATIMNSCIESRGSSGDCPPVYENVNMMVEDAITKLDPISVQDFGKLMESEEIFILIDVRAEGEHNAGYIPGSVLMPRGSLEFRISSEEVWEEEGMYVPIKEDPLIIYCKKGSRSALAALSLKQLGFKNIKILEGGFLEWKNQFPENVETNIDLSAGAGSQMISTSGSGGGC